MAYLAVVVSTVKPGDKIPDWVMPEVQVARMRTTAAILRDPNPAHWDEAASRARGLDGRRINQGPLNVGYIANMLMAWQGDAAVRRVTLQFPGRVLEGDYISARGEVSAITGDVATCEVWLERPDGTRPVVGTAVVAISRS